MHWLKEQISPTLHLTEFSTEIINKVNIVLYVGAYTCILWNQNVSFKKQILNFPNNHEILFYTISKHDLEVYLNTVF